MGNASLVTSLSVALRLIPAANYGTVRAGERPGVGRIDRHEIFSFLHALPLPCRPPLSVTGCGWRW